MNVNAMLTLTARNTDGHTLILRWPNTDIGIHAASDAITDWWRAGLLDMNGCMVFAQTARQLMDQADKLAP